MPAISSPNETLRFSALESAICKVCNSASRSARSVRKAAARAVSSVSSCCFASSNCDRAFDQCVGFLNLVGLLASFRLGGRDVVAVAFDQFGNLLRALPVEFDPAAIALKSRFADAALPRGRRRSARRSDRVRRVYSLGRFRSPRFSPACRARSLRSARSVRWQRSNSRSSSSSLPRE